MLLRIILTALSFSLILLAGYVSNQSFAFTGYDFISEWGSYGIAPGEFSQPQSIAVDEKGNVYITDLGNKRVQKFSSVGDYIDQWGQGGKESGDFYHPSGIAVSEESVYVVDRDLHRIQKFTLDGNFTAEWGIKGKGNGQFLFPSNVATGPEGSVYVVDTGNNRIQKFTSDGEYVLSIGSSGLYDGQFIAPVGIDVDDKGNIVVTDKGHGKIEKFNSTGNLIESFSFDAHDYDFSPTGIEIDPNGDMFTINSNRVLLLKQDSDMYLDKLEQLGPLSKEFSTPTDVELGVNGQLYVVDSTDQKIKVFETLFYVEPKVIEEPDVQETPDENFDDDEKPRIIPPPDLEVEANDFLTKVNLGEPVTYDESGIKAVLNNAPDKFSTGLFSVLWIAFDNAGNTAEAYQKVTVNACGNNRSHYNIISGTDGEDVLQGTDRPDLIFGLGGDDLIYGAESNDCIFGGEGGDIIYGMEGSDTIRGNSGDDVIKGQTGFDLLYGGVGLDVIDGGENEDRCYDIDDSQNDLIFNCES